MIAKKIILITGGERSGKSTFAEEMALRLSPHPMYVATARVWDEEFRQRILRHQERRGRQWTNVEEEKQLSRIDVQGRVVLVDCLTLWSTNYFFDMEGAPLDDILAELRAEFDRFTSQTATFIFVTNEIGMGGVSPNVVQRRFTDLLGWLNQYVAGRADEVTLMVSGIPVIVK